MIGPIEVFSQPVNELGECPRWHPAEQRLYWTDIERCRIYSQSVGEDTSLAYSTPNKVGCFAFRQDGGYLLATSNGIQFGDENLTRFTEIANPEAGKENARFNDGQVDASGRFWAGTMTEINASSCLYRLDPDLSLNILETGITISNGIGWSPDNDRMYFTDTLARTIFVYRFDLRTGSLSDRRVFIHTTGNGLPDGLCVDVEGYIWSVQCGAGVIHVYDPSANLVRKIDFPTRCITALTFGGPELRDLFVTSSRSLLSHEERVRDQLAGAVFRLKTGTTGIPQTFFPS